MRIGIATTLFAAVVGLSPTAFATDHENLEPGLPTSLEDIQPIERGTVQFQVFGRYLKFRGEPNLGESEPRLVWGAFDDTQLVVATPLPLGRGAASGNGYVALGVLRKLWGDRENRWWPGAALGLDLRLPTGSARQGFRNRPDIDLTVALKKDIGPHSFHLNVGYEWINDQSDRERFRAGAWRVIVGHDAPVTERVLLVTDVVWRQADVKASSDVWLVESGIRAQLTRRLIGTVGMGVGLNRGHETPEFTVTAGFQLGF